MCKCWCYLISTTITSLCWKTLLCGLFWYGFFVWGTRCNRPHPVSHDDDETMTLTHANHVNMNMRSVLINSLKKKKRTVWQKYSSWKTTFLMWQQMLNVSSVFLIGRGSNWACAVWVSSLWHVAGGRNKACCNHPQPTLQYTTNFFYLNHSIE